MKLLFQLCLIVTLAVIAGDAGGFETLDVKSWLAKPGVKLVAVEFYSTWCKPCMEAVPKWESLRKKYRDKGLRLIVVSVRDSEGCAVPAWSPDSNVCDEDGQIQQLWKADPLPKAYLFSWQGKTLVKRGSIDEVKTAIEQYFEETPRILVDDPTDETGAKLKNLADVKKAVRSEINRSSKFDLVADDKEIEEIRRLRKKFDNPNYDESVGCKLGKEVTANSQLKVTLKKNTKDGKAQLRLELFSMEQGCLLAGAKAPVPDVKELDKPIAEAVADLVQTLIGDFEYKSAGKTTDGGDVKKVEKKKIDTEEKGGEGQYSGYAPSGGEDVIVKFESDPPGVKVFFKGLKVCDATPCKAELTAGSGTFEFKSSDGKYENSTVSVQIKDGMKPVKAKLAAKFGLLKITSNPSGVKVIMDDKSIGETPIESLETGEGRHKVEVGDSVYVSQWKEFGIERGEKKEYHFDLKARQGGLKAKAKTKEGEPLEGAVYIDGKEIGKTGKIYAVNVGAHKVKVVTEKGEDEKDVEIKEGKEELVQFEIEEGGSVVMKAGDVKIEWVKIPGGTFMMGCSSGDAQCDDDEKPQHKVTVSSFKIMKYEVTQGQYEKVMGNNPSYFKGCGSNCPVESVSWNDAKAFCEKAGGRLPTEAEWEYAARGGKDTKYYCGNEQSCLDGIAWYYSNSGSKTHEVGQKKANGYGLFDMLGNVWE